MVNTTVTVMRTRRLRSSRSWAPIRGQVGSQAPRPRGEVGRLHGLSHGRGHGWSLSPKRLVTDRNQSSSRAWVWRRP